MKKRRIALLMAVSLIAGLMTGCGSSTKDSDAAEKKMGETLTFMCNGSDAEPYVEGYKKICEDFSANNEYGVTVEVEFYQNDDFRTKLTTLMASDAVPDIFFTWELGYLKPFVDGGKVADITSYLDEDTAWKESFTDGMLDLLSYDGKNYGVPTQRTFCVMFYNKRIFEENSVEVPRTYEEFLAVCETLKNNGVTPMSLAGADAWVGGQFIQQIANGMAGYDMFKGICDGTVPWNNEANIKAAEEVQRMVDDGYFQNGYESAGFEESREVFSGGNAAMHFMLMGDSQAICAGSEGENIGAFVMPAYDPQYSNISVGSVDTCLAIAESCENKDAAVAFLKYWTSKEAEEMLLYDYGRAPCGNFELDESKMSELLTSIMEIGNSQSALTPWWNRQFGAGEGNEFDNTCQAILGGADAAESFAKLQQFAADNAER